MLPIMPNNISPGAGTQGTINTMNTTPTNTKVLKPLGDLSVFPREIRDEIYRHVFPTSKKYRAFYSSSICRPAYYETPTAFKRKEWTGSNLSIMRLSKAIKDEAMALLYSEGTFCFHDCLFNPHGINVLQHQNADAINRMTNVVLFYDATQVFEDETFAATNPNYDCAGAGLLGFFQEVSVMRKSILIVLVVFDYYAWKGDATAMVASPLFKVLRHLTGFQTVTLRVIASYTSYHSLQSTAGTTAKTWQSTQQWAKLYAGLESILNAMSQDLEPTLGNSSAMSELVPGPEEFEYSGQRHVTFHPRDHLAAVSKAKKDAMEMKHTKGTKWKNE